MTRPAQSCLVLEGNTVKLRLQAERAAANTPVHIDWLRFTCLLRNAPFPRAEFLFPATSSIWDDAYRQKRFAEVLAAIPDPDFAPSAQALELAEALCLALGEGFLVHPEVLKGHDFYRSRWSIRRNDVECGWVGFLASGDSPRQQAQAQTIHANLYGSACTFAEPGWNIRCAELIQAHKGTITRADLALDFFEGLPRGRDLESVKADYMAGLMDSQGKRLKCSLAGDWCNGAERSFYVGSKEAGKQTNVYEKGHQLMGRESGSPWVRIELRWGNKLRVLPVDILRRPADFFAGASDWHAAQLRDADAVVSAESVKCVQALPVKTVAAEVARNFRWALCVAAPTIAASFKYLGDEFLHLVTNQKLPGRLQRFSSDELAQAFRLVVPAGGSLPGHLQAA